jgi:hypothetical protein
MVAMPAGYDNDNYKEFLVVSHTNITVFEYNGTSINTECRNTTLGSIATGIACANISGTIACYFGNNQGNITEFNAETCGISVLVNISQSDIFTTTNGLWQAPAMTDIDRDGNLEIILACDTAADNSEDICVIDQNSGNLDIEYNITATGASSTRIGGFLAWNVGGAVFSLEECRQDCKTAHPFWLLSFWLNPVDAIDYSQCREACTDQLYNAGFGGGDSEVIFTHYGVGGGNFDQDTVITVLKSDGSVDWTDIVKNDGSSGNTYFISPPVIMGTQFNDDTSQAHICTVTDDDTTNDKTHIDCYTEGGTKIYHEETASAEIWWKEDRPLVSASMNSVTDDNMDLVLGGGILFLNVSDNTTTTANFSTTMGSDFASYHLVADMDLDRNLDVCGQRANYVYCMFSPYDNAVPTLYNNISRGGYGYDLDVTRPVCANHTVTFSAQECGGTITNCNYVNDINEDLERIVSNCGQATNGVPSATFTENLLNGSFSGSTISNYSCFFNTTGTFNIRLYLQDDANDDDFTVYNTNTITVQVITGTPGLDCSFVPVNTDPGTQPLNAPTAEQERIDNSIDSTFGVLFGTSQRMRNLAAFAIIIGLVAGFGRKKDQNPATILFIGILAAGMVTFVGIMSGWVFVVTLISMVLVTIINKFVTGVGTAG